PPNFKTEIDKSEARLPHPYRSGFWSDRVGIQVPRMAPKPKRAHDSGSATFPPFAKCGRKGGATAIWIICEQLYHSTSSTRRFLARPSSVEFAATGEYTPQPNASSRAAAIPYLVVSSLTTLAARRLLKSML